MSDRIGAIIGTIEEAAPLQLAASWDNCGLMTGNPDREVRGVLLALDGSMEVAREALTRDCQLIVTHHPLIFSPLKTLKESTPEGELLSFLIKNDLSVYSAHTSLDHAAGGVSHMLADLLELKDLSPLVPHTGHPWKLVFYVPPSHREEVCSAVFAAGAGHMGQYSETRFVSAGEGSFVPSERSNPFVGTPGVRETVQEERVETLVPENLVQPVTEALRRVHPYEEPAFDLFRMEIPSGSRGLGLLGSLPGAMSLEELAGNLCHLLDVSVVKVAGKPSAMVEKVAVCGGSGRSVIGDAAAQGAGVLITGDIGYHDFQRALQLGLAVIDAGHDATERPVLNMLASRIGDAHSVHTVVSEFRPDIFYVQK